MVDENFMSLVLYKLLNYNNKRNRFSSNKELRIKLMFMFFINKIKSCSIHQKLFVQFYLCIPITAWKVVKQHR